MACIPPLLPENQDAEKVYLMVQDQLIVGMGGAIALNQLAIYPVMDLYQIEDRVTCFEKVVLVGRKVIQAENRKPKKGKK